MTTPDVPASESVAVRPELRTRTYRINPPRTPFHAVALRFKDAFEALIARSSLHGDPPVYDEGTFPWASEVEAEWQTIRGELEAVLARRAEMPSFHEIAKEVETITRDDQWKTFFLYAYGLDFEENARQCPETMRILRSIPGMTTAFFSILSPRKHIPAHRGAFNGLLRYHLGLIVPQPEEQCRIRIADRMCHWEEGRSLVFDDTYNHEVWNDTDGVRVVLFVDFARPLRFPMDLVNRAILSFGPLLPPLRRAQKANKEWAKRFYDRPESSVH